MPLQDFEDHAGRLVQVHLDELVVPGDVIKHKGRQLRRISAREAISREDPGTFPTPQIGRVSRPSFIGWNFPPNYAPHREAGGQFVKVDGLGEMPVFDSMRQVLNTKAAANHHGENLTYDDK